MSFFLLFFAGNISIVSSVTFLFRAGKESDKQRPELVISSMKTRRKKLKLPSTTYFFPFFIVCTLKPIDLILLFLFRGNSEDALEKLRVRMKNTTGNQCISSSLLCPRAVYIHYSAYGSKFKQ